MIQQSPAPAPIESSELVMAIRERDEARRWVCRLVSAIRRETKGTDCTHLQVARERGWDCFEEVQHDAV